MNCNNLILVIIIFILLLLLCKNNIEKFTITGECTSELCPEGYTITKNKDDNYCSCLLK